MSKQGSLFDGRPRKLMISRRISREEVEAARTPAGGWTRATLAQWGVPWPPPKGWRLALEIHDDGPPWEGAPMDPAMAEAMRVASEVRQWTDGPRPASWRVNRLAQALSAGK